MKTKSELDEDLSLLQSKRFLLTEDLRINSVSNTHQLVIKLKNDIESIDLDIEEINNTKYKDMK